MPYIGFPIETNFNTLLDRVYAYIQARVPGWTPAEGNLDVWLSEAFTAEAAELADVASITPDSIFRYLGQSLYGVEPISATSATTTTTWTMTDDDGHTIPAGTQVGIRNAAGELIPFYTINEVTVLPTFTVTGAGAVAIAALNPGASGSDLSGNVELIDILDFVSSIVTTSATTGGVDAETDAEYLNKLVARFKLLTITPVIPAEFAALAKTIPSVYRAVAIDLYNPYHNMLTANEASIETDATGWTSSTNATLAQSATQAADGTKSLRLTAASAADMAAVMVTSKTVIPGETYTAVAFFRASTTGRSIKTGIQWRDGADALISTSYGTIVADTNAAFTQASVTAIAPATAVKARVIIYVVAPANAEIHYVDKMGLRHGSTTDWVAGGLAETNNEKMVTVVSVDSAGNAVSGPIRSDVEELLESLRETNFVVNTMDPKSTLVDVQVQVKVLPGFDPATVQAATESAIAAFLNPATFGVIPAGVDGSNDPTSWQNRDTIYKFELASDINAVDGVDYINGQLKLALSGGVLAEQDLKLPGTVPLPGPGTITVTTVV